MKTETKPTAFVPRPWQLPHMLATPIGGAVLMAAIGSWAVSMERYRWQREAIEHNAASYICDPKTGETAFRWREGK